MTCAHTAWLCFYEDMTVNPPRFKAYCQCCNVETGWWPSQRHAEQSLRTATAAPVATKEERDHIARAPQS